MAGPKIPVRTRNLTGDPVQDRIDAARDELADMLRRCPFLFGKLVSVKLETTTTKVVNHRLGVPAAFIVIRYDYFGAATYPALVEATVAGIDLNNQLAILANTACKLDLWFYPRSSLPIDPATGQSR